MAEEYENSVTEDSSIEDQLDSMDDEQFSNFLETGKLPFNTSEES